MLFAFTCLFVGHFEQREDEVGLDVPNVFCVGYCKSKAALYTVFNAQFFIRMNGNCTIGLHNAFVFGLNV